MLAVTSSVQGESSGLMISGSSSSTGVVEVIVVPLPPPASVSDLGTSGLGVAVEGLPVSVALGVDTVLVGLVGLQLVKRIGNNNAEKLKIFLYFI